MKGRREQILKAIIEMFISTANPVGSKALSEIDDFSCSSATIRNEMQALEKEGFLTSPHTSAGRIPTTYAWRFFVSDLQDGRIEKFRPAIKKEFAKVKQAYFESKKADERIFDAVSILTSLTENVAFATIPSSKRTFFLGASKILSEPEFASHPDLASGIFRILEENFYELISSLDLSRGVQVFIGRENMIPEIQSCTLLASAFDVLGHKGVLGILGPMRMNFARNILALEETNRFLYE